MVLFLKCASKKVFFITEDIVFFISLRQQPLILPAHAVHVNRAHKHAHDAHAHAHAAYAHVMHTHVVRSMFYE
jgi:hypothetical protein